MKAVYFSYGSSMNAEQMARRVSSASKIGRARLQGSKMVFNKKSADGSGKANLIESPEGAVWGVVYEMQHDELLMLDRYKIGYHRIGVCVYAEKDPLTAYTHLSTSLTDRPLPYRWYKGLVLKGALENGLPDEYLEYLKNTPCVEEA